MMDLQVIFDIWEEHPRSPLEIRDSRGRTHRIRRADLLHVGATKIVYPVERDGFVVGDEEIRLEDIVELRELNGPGSRTWHRST